MAMRSPHQWVGSTSWESSHRPCCASLMVNDGARDFLFHAFQQDKQKPMMPNLRLGKKNISKAARKGNSIWNNLLPKDEMPIFALASLLRTRTKTMNEANITSQCLEVVTIL